MGEQLKLLSDESEGLALSGTLTATGWQLPTNLTRELWIECGQLLDKIESGSAWWRGDWWAYGEREWGEGEELANLADIDYGAMQVYGSVSRAYPFLRRLKNLTFGHHQSAMNAGDDLELRLEWLNRAEANGWSVMTLRREINKQRIGKATPLTGKHRVVYADPPWRYSDKMELPTEKGGESYGPAEAHYPAMSIEELCAMNVKSVVDDDAVLFLWVTVPLVRDSFQVIDAWGFEYKTHFVWDKIKHNMGHYSSVRHELLMVCTRGQCTPDENTLFDSVQSIERTEHSEKPNQFRKIIDALYTRGNKIELFARGDSIEGWSRWGNEYQREAAE